MQALGHSSVLLYVQAFAVYFTLKKAINCVNIQL